MGVLLEVAFIGLFETHCATPDDVNLTFLLPFQPEILIRQPGCLMRAPSVSILELPSFFLRCHDQFGHIE